MLFFEQKFFALFLCFFLLYWLTTARTRPYLIVATSFVFYGAWDWRFLFLLLGSITVDYIAGRKIENNTGNRIRQRLWLTTSLLMNLGALAFFKYFDFFSENFALLFSVPPENRILLDVILPAGISFYTFQTLSYTIDVYRGEIRAERNFLTFAAFVSFFPQLIAGPIERAGDLIAQIVAPATLCWTNVYFGTRLFVFGLFKKLVIADNLAKFVDPVFADPGAQDPLTLLLAAYCFAFQIYCDFSGYTDMARGLARSIGIRLSENFNFPYLATGVRDFWRRWHITLYSWLRDYVYFPLGGSRFGTLATARNTMIVFLASGLWHGAGWNYILWGGLHGIYISSERVLAETLVGRSLSKLPAAARMILTFHLVTFAWILFRTPDLASFTAYIQGLAELRPIHLKPTIEAVALTYDTYRIPALGGSTSAPFYIAALLILTQPLVVAQYFRSRGSQWVMDKQWPVELRYGLLVVLSLCIYMLKADSSAQFIYFQF